VSSAPQVAPAMSKERPGEQLARLFESHHGLVFQAAYRLTGSASDAEDVLQTVFLRLLRRDLREPLAPNAEGYLRRSAVNAALDLLRARSRSRTVPLSEAESMATSQVDPERATGERELKEWLRRAVAGLSGRAAEVFALRYLEGLSHPQIARLLGTSQAVIAVTLHRTRGRLRRQIRLFLGEET
jgi:RNA polymerase sigma factor (sigma-70 family)